MTKPKDTLTVSETEPPQFVDITRGDPEFPERATVSADGLDHWLALGWQAA